MYWYLCFEIMKFVFQKMNDEIQSAVYGKIFDQTSLSVKLEKQQKKFEFPSEMVWQCSRDDLQLSDDLKL